MVHDPTLNFSYGKKEGCMQTWESHNMKKFHPNFLFFHHQHFKLQPHCACSHNLLDFLTEAVCPSQYHWVLKPQSSILPCRSSRTIPLGSQTSIFLTSSPKQYVQEGNIIGFMNLNLPDFLTKVVCISREIFW